MRDLKFRAWDKADAAYWEPKGMVYFEFFCVPAFISYGFHPKDSDKYEPRFEVMQFTGLKDKGGKEIYEGDIVSFCVFDHNGRDTQYVGLVKWANAAFEIWHDADSQYYGSDGGFDLAWTCDQDDEFEVIGNVHENPELLRKEVGKL